MKTKFETVQEAAKFIALLYKREIDNTNFFRTQVDFDDYVFDYCKALGIFTNSISDDQLFQCALNFIENDGGGYLLDGLSN